MEQKRPDDVAVDVVEAVLADHRRFRTLFEEFERATGDDRARLWQMLVRGLAVHETAEEEIVHPRTRRLVDGGDDIVDARVAEEDEAKKALAALERAGLDDPEFEGRYFALKGDVLAHADAEEREELPALRECTTDEDRRRMGSIFDIAKATAPTHAHALAPESATGNLVIGPVVALMDRVRDAIRDARS
jgi:hemerythrin superfamily protein